MATSCGRSEALASNTIISRPFSRMKFLLSISGAFASDNAELGRWEATKIPLAAPRLSSVGCKLFAVVRDGAGYAIKAE